MDFKNKIAFITGGANGAGFGQAQVFGQAGCRVFIVDIRKDALEAALDRLKAEGIVAQGAVLDLTDREAYAYVADEVEHVYGEPPHLLFNTAGVFAMGPAEASRYEDFDWVLGVNLNGVVNGMVTFVPRMIKAGRPGHIVSTASYGGFFGGQMTAAYSASKAAVINLMESYRQALARYDIGVSVLCPMNIKTNIGRSSQTRPAHLGKSGYVVSEESMKSLESIYRHGMEPVDLARHVMAGIEANQLYIIPYPEGLAPLEAHFKEILSAIPDVSTDPEGAARRTQAMQDWAKERGELFSRKSGDAPL